MFCCRPDNSRVLEEKPCVRCPASTVGPIQCSKCVLTPIRKIVRNFATEQLRLRKESRAPKRPKCNQKSSCGGCFLVRRGAQSHICATSTSIPLAEWCTIMFYCKTFAPVSLRDCLFATSTLCTQNHFRDPADNVFEVEARFMISFFQKQRYHHESDKFCRLIHQSFETDRLPDSSLTVRMWFPLHDWNGLKFDFFVSAMQTLSGPLQYTEL